VVWSSTEITRVTNEGKWGKKQPQNWGIPACGATYLPMFPHESHVKKHSTIDLICHALLDASFDFSSDAETKKALKSHANRGPSLTASSIPAHMHSGVHAHGAPSLPIPAGRQCACLHARLRCLSAVCRCAMHQPHACCKLMHVGWVPIAARTPPWVPLRWVQLPQPRAARRVHLALR